MDSKLIVIAIGGNSLIEDSRHVTVSAQAEAAAKTAHHIAKLIKEGHKVVIAHGNGPQVGYILLRAEYARKILHTVPLDSCVADTQGAIGYQLQQALSNELRMLAIEKDVATIVTQVLVDDDDPNNDYYTIIVDYFPTVFNCIYNDTYTWDWATIEEMA